MAVVQEREDRQGLRHGRSAGARGGSAALALLCGVQLMLVLDFSIVNVALPDIARGLGFDRAGLSWVLSAYALTFGGLLLLGGRLADLLGRRRMFLVGLAVFGAGSLLGGLSVDPTMLVLMRAVQGAGGALTAPAVLSLITTTFPEGPERGRALGWFSAAGASGFAVGVLAGGLLTQIAGWRAVMFVNVPLVAAAMVLGRRLLPESSTRARGRHYDLAGALCGTAGLSAVIFGLVQIGQSGAPLAARVAPLAAGAVLLAGFVLVEARVAAPLLPLRLFRSRSLSAANGLSALTFITAGAMPLLLSLQLQQVMGFDPLLTGLAFLPSSVVVALSAQTAPRLAVRVGAKPVLLAGTALVAAGAALLVRVSGDSAYASVILPATILFGVGLGAVVTTTTIAATDRVPASDQGVVSGLLITTQQVGVALGVAVLASLASLQTQALGMPTPDAVAAGISVAFLAGAGIAAASTLVALVALPTGRNRHRSSYQRGNRSCP